MKNIFLIGDPITQSLSPAMHNAAFRALGIRWQYTLLETPMEKLRDAIARVRAEDGIGANVTIPHKESVIAYLDELDPHARQAGSVNTLVKRAGKLIGFSTDGYGLLQALRDEQVDVRGARVVILGAGGAARAVAFALVDAGVASITIFNRTATRAETLADLVRAQTQIEIRVNAKPAMANATLIVNTTPNGTLPPGTTFPRNSVAFDLVYRPTEFLRDAEHAGAKAIGGLGMLVHQGAASFKLWAGRDAPVDAMFRAVRS